MPSNHYGSWYGRLADAAMAILLALNLQVMLVNWRANHHMVPRSSMA